MSGNLASSAENQISIQKFPGAPSLALTFLFAGIGFSLPFSLFPVSHPQNGPASSEILNLNFLVAWMGLAHFVFAFSGQGKYLTASKPRGAWLFVGGLAASAGLLWLCERAVGGRLFAFIIWVYFIPHFIKAEMHFARTTGGSVQKGWVLYWFPALAFAFLTFALFGPKGLTFNTALLIALAILCVAAGVAGGIRQQLYTENAKYTLLAFFFIGEALVWGTYSKYMTPQFRQGVYVFHIAVASFYHYFRSYAFAMRKAVSPGRLNRHMGMVIGVNVATILIGMAVVHNGTPLLGTAFDISFFTFWVGLHLVSSDLFSLVRKVNQPRRLS